MPSELVRSRLDLAMPAHNEGASIKSTLEEWWSELSPTIDLRFIISEDGSSDNTKEVLRELEHRYPMLLDMAEARRGYNGAMNAALRASATPYVLAVDSDGQCDPKDFRHVWEMRERFDLVMGWRVNRADPFIRKAMSRSFKLYHKLLFGTRLHDPSCPFVLMNRWVIDTIVPTLRLLREGYWWEFTARALKQGVRIGEVPVNHRLRSSGSTVVYKPARVPGIAWRNGLGLLRIWRER